MKHFIPLLALALVSVSVAKADSCTVSVLKSEVGVGKTYGDAELKAFGERGYSVHVMGENEYDPSATFVTIGSSCTSNLFGKFCKYSVQLGHMSGNSMFLDRPAMGKSLKAAILALPRCN